MLQSYNLREHSYLQVTAENHDKDSSQEGIFFETLSYKLYRNETIFLIFSSLEVGETVQI